MSHESLAERIRRLRLQRGMSQDALARHVEGSRQHVYSLEHGRVSNMRSDTLDRYASALGVSAQYLLRGNDDTPEPPLPALASYLRRSYGLAASRIEIASRVIGALEAEQRLELVLSGGVELQELGISSIEPLAAHTRAPEEQRWIDEMRRQRELP